MLDLSHLPPSSSNACPVFQTARIFSVDVTKDRPVCRCHYKGVSQTIREVCARPARPGCG